MPYFDYREMLIKELEERKKRNPSYSLRAFARYLKMSPSNLSTLLNARSGLSLQRALEIGEILGFSEEKMRYFCLLVEASDARCKKAKRMAQEQLHKLSIDNERQSISVECEH